MSRPSPRRIQKWWPTRWSEIAGNDEVKSGLIPQLHQGPCNTLVTGSTGSCKTRILGLFLKALACPERASGSSDPCNVCQSCLQMADGILHQTGLFAACSNFEVHSLDCENLTSVDIEEFLREVNLQSETIIVYLDEVAALGRRGLERKLLKPIDESEATWIGSSVSVKRVQGKRKGEWVEQLSPEMRRRFGLRLATGQPTKAQLEGWILDRVRDWEISIESLDVVSLLTERSRQLVGEVTHVLSKAASRSDRLLSLSDVREFRFDAAD